MDAQLISNSPRAAKRKKKIVSIYIEPSLLAEIDDVAEMMRLPRSWIISRIFEEWLDDRKKPSSGAGPIDHRRDHDGTWDGAE